MSALTRGTVPRAAAVVLGATVAFLTVAFLVLGILWVLRGGKDLTGLTKDEQSAVDAAKQEAINIQTFRQKSFDSDFEAALSGLTPTLKAELQGRKAAVLKGLQQAKQDNSASVSGAGLISLKGNDAVVLVAADSLRTDSSGKTSTFLQNRFQVKLTKVNGKWLTDNIAAVSIS
jgi:hypothetical protein